MVRKNTLPYAPFGRILEKEGAKRVSAEAKEALAEVISEQAKSITKKASTLAIHSGRKTVTSEDIMLAAK